MYLLLRRFLFGSFGYLMPLVLGLVDLPILGLHICCPKIVGKQKHQDWLIPHPLIPAMLLEPAPSSYPSLAIDFLACSELLECPLEGSWIWIHAMAAPIAIEDCADREWENGPGLS